MFVFYDEVKISKYCSKTLSLCWVTYLLNIKHYYNIIQNHGEAFSTFQDKAGILFSLEGGFFLPRNGAICSDNWRYQISQKRLESTSLAKTRVWAILSALPQMSRAKGDVSTWQMLLGVWVCLELTEPLWWWWTISHSNENLNSPGAKSPFMGCREKLTASGSRGRGVSNVRGKKVRAHSRVCLPLKMERLLPVHNIPWLSCAFAIHWASLR